MKPDILYEDNDIIVCYKPAKLAVQTARTGIPDMALLSGRPAKPQGTLVDYLVKDSKTNSSSVCTPATPCAKQAILHYTVAEASKDSCLVNIRLETGRHHQIRVQMRHAGMSLLGDYKVIPNTIPPLHIPDFTSSLHSVPVSSTLHIQRPIKSCIFPSHLLFLNTRTKIHSPSDKRSGHYVLTSFVLVIPLHLVLAMLLRIVPE